jgi:hypothetical protein
LVNDLTVGRARIVMAREFIASAYERAIQVMQTLLSKLCAPQLGGPICGP